MNHPHSFSRRKALKGLAALATIQIVPRHVIGRGIRPPSEQLTRGIIGCGGISGSDAHVGQAGPLLALCDVDRQHLAARTADAKKRGHDPKGYHDFRELCARDDIDAVMIATPDHWHGLITLEALRHGKDVYCEKPVTHFFAEGQAVYKTVAEKKRIFQVGSQQRSDDKFRHAVNIVRNGLIGKVTKVEVGLPRGQSKPDGDPALVDAPEGYDEWCGPSPMLPYMRARHHWSWRWHTAYGRGQLMDWIGHHNDIAHWGLGLEATGGGGGPISVEAKNWDFSKTPDIYDTAYDYDVISKYASGAEVVMSSRTRMGCKWIGTDGWIWVDRG
jgi:predicted dehydrogenase